MLHVLRRTARSLSGSPFWLTFEKYTSYRDSEPFNGLSLTITLQKSQLVTQTTYHAQYKTQVWLPNVWVGDPSRRPNDWHSAVRVPGTSCRRRHPHSFLFVFFCETSDLYCWLAFEFTSLDSDCILNRSKLGFGEAVIWSENVLFHTFTWYFRRSTTSRYILYTIADSSILRRVKEFNVVFQYFQGQRNQETKRKRLAESHILLYPLRRLF